MDLDDLFPDTYEGRLEADMRMRMGRIAYLLGHGRVAMNGQLRQVLGYMLDEDDWLVDPIKGMAVKPDGVVYALMVYGGRRRSPMEVFMYGKAPEPAQVLQPYCDHDFLLDRLRDLGERAGLDQEDTDWLCTLPQIRDLRGKPEEAPEESEE